MGGEVGGLTKVVALTRRSAPIQRALADLDGYDLIPVLEVDVDFVDCDRLGRVEHVLCWSNTTRRLRRRRLAGSFMVGGQWGERNIGKHRGKKLSICFLCVFHFFDLYSG